MNSLVAKMHAIIINVEKVLVVIYGSKKALCNWLLISNKLVFFITTIILTL